MAVCHKMAAIGKWHSTKWLPWGSWHCCFPQRQPRANLRKSVIPWAEPSCILHTANISHKQFLWNINPNCSLWVLPFSFSSQKKYTVANGDVMHWSNNEYSICYSSKWPQLENKLPFDYLFKHCSIQPTFISETWKPWHQNPASLIWLLCILKCVHQVNTIW